MREIPALFSPPMVRAALDGRKTQTRRARGLARFTERGVFHRMERRADTGEWFAVFHDSIPDDPCPIFVPSPFGGPGDRLWVRETWGLSRDTGGDWLRFAAGGAPRRINCDGAPRFRFVDDGRRTWRPSIHMPRWASRLTLEVTDVRVERLQAISREDCIAEGCTGFDPEPVSEGGTYYVRQGFSSAPDPRAHFQILWESIHGVGSWEANPWVWVVSFKSSEARP